MEALWKIREHSICCNVNRCFSMPEDMVVDFAAVGVRRSYFAIRRFVSTSNPMRQSSRASIVPSFNLFLIRSGPAECRATRSR